MFTTAGRTGQEIRKGAKKRRKRSSGRVSKREKKGKTEAALRESRNGANRGKKGASRSGRRLEDEPRESNGNNSDGNAVTEISFFCILI